MLVDELTPQTFRVVIGAVIGLIFVLALPGVRLFWLNPSRYYTYEGTTGPLEAIHNANGTVTAGRPISTIRPGESFVWVRTICFAKKVNVVSVIELRNMTTKQIVTRREFETARDEGCGPRTIEVQVPADAPAGIYSADRRLMIDPSGEMPVAVDLPAVEIEVVRK